MQFERNDEIFGDAAARYGLSEPAVEEIILAMMWAGERAMESASLAQNLQQVIRRTLLALSTKGEFARHVSGATPPLSKVTTLAICTATHRLCLWFRAHEVGDAAALANYFETAFTYYAEYWRGKSGEDVTTGLSAFHSKIKSCRISAASGRGPRGRSAVASRSGKRGAPAAADRAGDLPQVGGSVSKGSRGARPPSGHPRPLQPRQSNTTTAASLRRDSTGGAVTSAAGTKVNGAPLGGGLSAPKFSTSLEVDLSRASPIGRSRVTEGRTVQMGPSKHDGRRCSEGGTWIVLGRGRALNRSATVGGEPRAEARRSVLLGNLDEVAAPRKLSRMPSPPHRAAPRPATVNRDNALLFDDDTDESNWWTRKYDEPAYDSDFEPEHSEGDPNSDIEDNALGEEEGKPTSLDVDDFGVEDDSDGPTSPANDGSAAEDDEDDREDEGEGQEEDGGDCGEEGESDEDDDSGTNDDNDGSEEDEDDESAAAAASGPHRRGGR